MSPHQREDVTRTIRVDTELGTALQGIAEEEGLSVNSLINKILWKYVSWDASALKFGMMTYSASSFARLLDHLTEEEVRAYSNEVGGLRTKEMVAFWFKEVSYQNYLKLLKLIEEYAGLFRMEERFQGGDRTIVCQHEMGRKFSIFLDEGFKTAFTGLFGATVEVDISDNQVIVHVPDQIAVRQPKSEFSSS